MNFWEWLTGRKPPPEEERTNLSVQQNQIAGRLAKMRGSTRDEVLSEAYRRARLAKEAASYRDRR